MKQIVLALSLIISGAGFSQSFQDYCENIADLPSGQQHFIRAVLTTTGTECATLQKEVSENGTLDLANEDIVDISLLPSIAGIEDLDLSGNHIKTILNLSQLTELEALDISENRITDLSPLTKLTALKKLDAGNLPLKNLEPLLKLPTIERLNIEGDTLWDYGSLKNLVNLTSLNVGYKYWISSSRCDRDKLRANRQSLAAANSLDAVLPFFSQLESFSSNGINFTSTKSMEKLKKLKYLRVKCASIEETGVLAELPDLKLLELIANRLKKVEAPENESKLVNLRLDDNFLTDIGFLESLNKIEVLDLSRNALSGKLVFSSHESLIYLNLAYNNLSHVKLDGEFRRMDYLDFSHNGLTHVEFANTHQRLRYFDVRGNFLRDPSAGVNLKGLNYLDVGYNLIEDYSFINSIRKPRGERDRGLRIKVGGNPSNDFRAITNHRLFDFSARDSNMTSIDTLPATEGISRIDLGGNRITTLQGLNSKYRYVFYLKLDHNPISTGKSLEELDKLGVLDLSYTKISDYSFLANLPNLGSIILRGNRIVNLDVLPLIKKLKTVDLAHNSIVDLSVFEKMTNEIHEINLTSNLIEDVTPLKDLKGNWMLWAPKLADNPLGTTMAKTEKNCPTTTASLWLNRWCSSQ